MSWPSIDHGLLSPSGHISKRARKAAFDREVARLFPEGFNAMCAPKPLPKLGEREALLQQAARLRGLADRGMCVRKYRREADRLEAEAARLEDGR